jgi:hypothetical protein
MAWKLKYRCRRCGYEAEVYEGRGLFRQEITAMSCPDCKTIQNIVVGGIIADVAPEGSQNGSNPFGRRPAATNHKYELTAPLPSDWENKWHHVEARYDGRQMIKPITK